MQALQSSTNAVAQGIPSSPMVDRNNEATVTITSDPNAEYTRVFAEAVQLRHTTNRLLQESRTLSDHSRSLKQWWRAYRQNRTQSQRNIVLAQCSSTVAGRAVSTHKQPLATARRIPWRRLQMEDFDGRVVEWTAPEYTEVFP